ncbi:MAG: protein TolR [Mariprofundales bacterium]|nr:protein TolR [Mariprofundales bacterium]
MWTGQNRWSSDMEPMGEINVTPLVDVMLVLLIIFMVTAPLLTQGVNVDLPDTAAQELNQNVEPLVISIQRDGAIYLQHQRIIEDQLVPKILAIRHNKPNIPIYIRGDAKVYYEHIARIMALLEKAGVRQIGLVTELHSH